MPVEPPEDPRRGAAQGLSGGAAWVASRADLRMSLMDHLGELRKRLLRSAIAVLILSVLGMFIARPLFAWLMRPVLAALPVGGKSLIYTSGIEEVNVLLKVGLYAGLSISTPIILWQLWSFISPGLLPQERRYAAPFILAGTLAFVAGAAFCYYAVLPQMFGFLLSEGQERPVHERLDRAQQVEQDALRFLRLGEAQRAGDLAHGASGALSEAGDAQIVLDSDGRAASSAEVWARLEALGRLIDALQVGFSDTARPVLVRAMERRQEAIKAETSGNTPEASVLADQAAALLGAAVTHGAESLSDLWKLEKLSARGNALIQAEQWTRPMLSMSEQLSLVLALEIAFGGIFELPLIMALLTALGLVKASFLLQYQRHALVVCLILAAVITPTGDVINLMMMCGPMVLCYELGTLASWLIERRRARQAAAVAHAVEPTP